MLRTFNSGSDVGILELGIQDCMILGEVVYLMENQLVEIFLTNLHSLSVKVAPGRSLQSGCPVA